MVHRRNVIAFIVLIFFLLSASSGFALLQCGEGIGNPLFFLATAGNSHVEPNPSPNGYPIGIGCVDPAIPGLSIVLDPSAAGVEVLRLSTANNAHVELPGYAPQVYTNLIKINDNQSGTLDVQTTSDDDCSTVNGGALTYVPLLHLGRVTNSHAEKPRPNPAYQNTICLAYNAGGVNPTDNIIQTSIPAGGFANVIVGQSAAANIVTSNQVFGDPQYSNITTFNVTAICEVGMGDCDTLTDYTTVNAAIVDISQGAYNGSIIPASIKVMKFGSDPNQDLITNGLIAQGISVTADPNPFVAASNNIVYTVDTAALNLAPTKIYRVITLDWRARFDFPTTGSQWSEDGGQLANNFASFVFTVLTACGTGAEQCNDPSGGTGCASGYTCNLFCMCITGGGTVPGIAGDVYVLKNINFPNVYTNNDIEVELTIENKNTILTGQNPTATINVIVRDSKGIAVNGFNPAQFQRQISGAADVETITIQTAANPFLRVGETYTLYATIQPYNDTSVNNLDETIITNNSGFKTFTAINPPQAYAVPDAPWWMSVLLVLSVIGFLFTQAKRKNSE